MKKKIGFGIVGIIVIAACAFGIYRWKLSITPGDGSEARQKIEYLNEGVDFKLLLYGDDIDFPKELKYEKISSLECANWQKDNDCVYLIINDLNNNIDFDKDSYLEIKKYADKNLNFNFYYLGTDDLEMIQNNTEDCNLNDTDMSFGYIVYEGNRLIHYGLWSENDNQYLDVNPDLLSENIYSRIVENLKSNE